ncbi:class I SAM-dependent methyltransferase [Granulicoccus phenolivorans]|uniref:class I SAM-dependent methyltransferase n=1 Tax=Granulicoccus phenolivorans TaxID=266854 RepID=UPI000427FA3F|nr:class I SAM-dependent methyltransferase [Granulicoccus phenolivorans]
MSKYHLLYRLRITPWERYRTAAAGSVARLLNREAHERPELGRALDLGCGLGHYTRELARQGWTATGIDAVAGAIERARTFGDGDVGDGHVRFVEGDVRDLAEDLGTFDFFLDVGCLEGLDDADLARAAASITARANPGATLLMLAFGPRFHWLIDGLSREQIERAFAGWTMLRVEPAQTRGLGWPMNMTSPHWYRLRLA